MAEKVKSSEITPENTYLSRRNFVRAGIFAGSTIATAGIYKMINPPPPAEVVTAPIANIVESGEIAAGDELTSFENITNYNNFYEFSTSKTAVAGAAESFVTEPWTISVEGAAGKPRIFGMDEILRFTQEERIYRFRCVEGWSMVIPWVGFSLKLLLDKVEPLSSAKFVAFQTFYGGENPSGNGIKLPQGENSMQSSFSAGIEFPYVEGLRMDEAMHPLTTIATGIYGKRLPNQNGAPVRLVVPWKYGFKSIKSIVRIRLTETEPPTTWNLAAPSEYGFYSNVNPEVPHRRWSQATERRIGEIGTRKTLMFNGYADDVAGLYSGMDLRRNF